jgi:hypothetical protein
MEYHEQQTLQDRVNTKGTKLWVKMNDNSKAAKNRAAFISEHGGFFSQGPGGWIWNTPVQEQNGYWLQRVDTGEKVFFSNMKEFGDKYDIHSVKICELLNGKRKTYKGWTAVEIREVKDGVGRVEKAQEEKAEKILVTKEATFVDRTTGQVIHVPNIGQFARDNNIDKNALYKLARGKLKSYKNLKLFNPFEKYEGSSDT